MSLLNKVKPNPAGKNFLHLGLLDSMLLLQLLDDVCKPNDACDLQGSFSPGC